MPDSTMLQSKDLQERYERYKAKIKNFTIMNDIFMRNVLKKKKCTEYILQVIMEDKGITVIDQTLQKDYKNLQGRSAILDCVAKDTNNRQFNVEIQGDNEGASPKRALALPEKQSNLRKLMIWEIDPAGEAKICRAACETENIP